MSLAPVPESMRLVRDEVVLVAFQALEQGFAPRARTVVITQRSPTCVALTIQPRRPDGTAAAPELEYALECAQLLTEGCLVKEVRTPGQPTPVAGRLVLPADPRQLRPQAIMHDVLAEWRRGFT